MRPLKTFILLDALLYGTKIFVCMIFRKKKKKRSQTHFWNSFIFSFMLIFNFIHLNSCTQYRAKRQNWASRTKFHPQFWQCHCWRQIWYQLWQLPNLSYHLICMKKYEGFKSMVRFWDCAEMAPNSWRSIAIFFSFWHCSKLKNVFDHVILASTGILALT